MAIKESGEMYLETILVLSSQLEHVRAIDISECMGYSKPSVSKALSILKNEGLVKSDRYGFICLTDTGKKVAETIYERHTVLTKVLMSLGVTEAIAAEDACRIEHVISDVSMNAIRCHSELFRKDDVDT